MGRIKCRFDGLDVHKSNISVGTALSTSSLKPMCGAASKYSHSGYVLCNFLEWSTVLKNLVSIKDSNLILIEDVDFIRRGLTK